MKDADVLFKQKKWINICGLKGGLQYTIGNYSKKYWDMKTSLVRSIAAVDDSVYMYMFIHVPFWETLLVKDISF